MVSQQHVAVNIFEKGERKKKRKIKPGHLKSAKIATETSVTNCLTGLWGEQRKQKQ